VPLPQLWALAQAWYRDRLSPGYVRPGVEVLQERLARVGLVGEFWTLAG
jgi:hypothetical protein